MRLQICPAEKALLVTLASIVVLVFSGNSVAQDAMKNSTRKNRVRPNALAARAGSAVNWEADLQSAISKSQQTEKPVFWYVPTIRGTFMDRKAVIDQYMMAGYFSWPRAIDLLNTHFIPVKAAPTREQQKQFKLSAYKFVEPGFLVLKPDQQVSLKIDRLTTQHIGWFLNVLAKQTSDEDLQDSVSKELGRFPITLNIDESLLDLNWPADADKTSIDLLAENRLITGMAQFRAGKHHAARNTWNSLADKAPHHPLTWKAAAEAQGIGPFVRGFEVFTRLPENCLEAGIASVGSSAPPETFTEKELWHRGTEFLLSMQNENGGYLDSDYDFGGSDSLGNVHVATTSLVAMALMKARARTPVEQLHKLDDAIEKCFRFVSNEKNLNRIDRDEILWADAYRLRFISRYKTTLCKEVANELQSAVKSLENIQSRRGTWYHEYQNPFVTATALCALHEARKAGASTDDDKIQRGLKALSRERFGDGSFPYYTKKNDAAQPEAKSVQAAAGRMPICELALSYWGQSDQARLAYALKKSFEFHRHLNVSLKYDNHTSTLGYGGFFFWYDMRSRTEAIAAIEDGNLRNSLMKRQKEIVLQLPEIDGCFVDSHELGRCYGTAMALLCLARIDESMETK